MAEVIDVGIAGRVPPVRGAQQRTRQRAEQIAAASVAVVMNRCTARLLTLVSKPDPAAVEMPPADDDWYANIMWAEGRKCLRATHAGTLFAIFAPDVRADDLRSLGPILAARAAEQLTAKGLPADVLGDLDAARTTIGKTASRQILRCMNDQAFAIRWIVKQDGGMPARTSGGSTVICKATSSRPASIRARRISSPSALPARDPRPLPVRTGSS